MFNFASQTYLRNENEIIIIIIKKKSNKKNINKFNWYQIDDIKSKTGKQTYYFFVLSLLIVIWISTIIHTEEHGEKQRSIDNYLFKYFLIAKKKKNQRQLKSNHSDLLFLIIFTRKNQFRWENHLTWNWIRLEKINNWRICWIWTNKIIKIQSEEKITSMNKSFTSEFFNWNRTIDFIR